ncbi:MAG TPA: S9 family peptidase [Candidatus Acidoferrales bacterium]|nr:S9 family peptidase [Candidatus Acidoferrales bacterium]
MRARIGFVALAAALLSLATSSPNTREITDPKTLTSAEMAGAVPVPIADLFFTRTTGGGAWSPDGKEIVFASNFTGRANLWKVNSSGGWPIQLAQSDDRQSGAVWSPDGKWILYQSDRGGGEIYDLFAIPSSGGPAINLTNTDDISETNADWAPDGKSLAISYKPKTAPVTDIAILDWSTRSVRNLTHEASQDHIWAGYVWSPDSKFIYGTRVNAHFTDESIFRIDVATGKQDELTPHEGELRYEASSISPDGKRLLLTADRPGGYPNVALLDTATKKVTWVTDTQWQAEARSFAPDGNSFTYIINEDGRTAAYMGNTASGRGREINLAPGLNMFSGNPTPYSPDGRRLLVSHQSSTQPSDLWVYDIGTQQARQLSFSAIGSLQAAKIPASHLVHYKSFDGKVISAFLWVPYNLQRDASNPGIVLPHGGPTGQTLDSFSRSVIALVSRGYVVIAPNVRGSTGYGLEFQNANVKDLGGGDLEDEVAGAKFMVATGYVDEKKIGITGGSYGGYMTLMAIGKKPDLWAAAVEQYGIINWFTMLQHEDPFLQEYEKSLLGDPEKDRAVYENASPIKFLRSAKAPLLVLQGENDIRVPKEEAEQVVAIYKEMGRPVDAHFYPQEGHGFAKRENQIDATTRMVEWFDRYLKGKP